ncbi:MAG TPA: response regulator [Desulfosalsimonadaceae bacterium]|nr:response regulator [Desulfosalsimonadaceae bacterium]
MDKLKVLLVDDEEEFVSALAERLDIRGIAAHVATDGEQALEMIETEAFQVIVLDVIMPGISGLEVLQRINAKQVETAVILLTGHGSTKEGLEGMRMGAFDYLMKPLDIDELISKMHEAVESTKAQRG